MLFFGENCTGDGASPALRQAASLDEMIEYRDIGRLLLDENGAIPDDAMMSDRLHLKTKGYEIWAAAIEEDVTRLMGER